jgi:hypothetical protein
MVLTRGQLRAKQPFDDGFRPFIRQVGDARYPKPHGTIWGVGGFGDICAAIGKPGRADEKSLAGPFKSRVMAVARTPEVRSRGNGGIVRLGRALRAELTARIRRLLQAARMELRIDVRHPDESIEAELDALYRRLHTPGAAMSKCTRLPPLRPGLVFHHREADGEHYVYVEDAERGRLAGYTVFNRLIEVDRRADRHVRSPHSKYAPAYQRRGIASAVYHWALGRGFCLVSGARQSEGAHALWRALARRHALRWVALHDKRMYDLGPTKPPAHAADLDTRMLLLGDAWNLDALHMRGVLRPATGAADDIPVDMRVHEGQPCCSRRCSPHALQARRPCQDAC